MTATITVANGNSILNAVWKAAIPKMQMTIEHFAHGLWDRGRGDHGTEEEPIAWEDLNNQDKINIWFDYVTMMTLNDARAYGEKAAKEVANDIEKIAVETRYSLGEPNGAS